jgi:hypothetical protein
MNNYLILAAATETTSVAMSLLGYLPAFLFSAVFLAVLFFLARNANKANSGYLNRAREHMDALEKKADRIIQLLEEIKNK